MSLEAIADVLRDRGEHGAWLSEMQEVLSLTIIAFCEGRADAAHADELAEVLSSPTVLRLLFERVRRTTGPTPDRVQIANATFNALVLMEETLLRQRTSDA